MATVVHTTPGYAERDSGAGFLLAVILLFALAVLFFMYGVPYLRSATSGPNVNVPGKIDVNVNTPNGGSGTGQ